MKTITGDLLAIGAGVILHQANCYGKTGGLAGALRGKFPRQFRVYDQACEEHALSPRELLGRARCGFFDGVGIVHCFGQLAIGRDRQHTDMVAVAASLAEAAAGIQRSEKIKALPVFAPYLMGCDRGGGDWAEYERLLSSCFPDITIVRHPVFGAKGGTGPAPVAVAIASWPARRATHCWRCGQQFDRRSLLRASEHPDGLLDDGPEDLCLGCFLEVDREIELCGEPLNPAEQEVAAAIEARNEVRRQGWRIECVRIGRRKRRFETLIFSPDGVFAGSVCSEAGLEAWSAGREGWKKAVELAAKACAQSAAENGAEPGMPA